MSKTVNKYMKDLKLEAAGSMAELKKKVAFAADRTTAARLVRIMEGEHSVDADEAIYEIMNTSPRIAQALVGAFDGDYLKKLFTLIEAHRDTFGEEILDAGCNNGIITCFIAKTYPDSQVTGIDINPQAIDIAQQIADRLKLENVVFRVQALGDVEEQYDTLFLSKVSHEKVNSATIGSATAIEWSSDKDKMADQFQKMLAGFAGQAANTIKTGGSLWTIDRIPYDFGVTGYYRALEEAGIQPGTPSSGLAGAITYRSLGKKESLPFMIGRKAVKLDCLFRC